MTRARAFNLGTALLCTLIFLTAVAVSFMHWQDMRGGHPLAGMEAGEMARLLLNSKFALFVRPTSPDDLATLIRPPGYPILVAAVFEMFGTSDAVMRTFQILCNAAAAVLAFFIAAKLLSGKTAPTIAGFLIAFSPQLASYSFLLLPDSIVALPILAAMYAVIRLVERPRYLTAVVVGILIGLSCWLRAKMLLLSPFLSVLIIILLRQRRVTSVRYAAAMVTATILVVAPITLRNWIVFHRFIPIQIGAGVTLVEGIADYDTEKRFGLPRTDIDLCRTEAALYNRPDYLTRLLQSGGASTWYPDGLKREDARLARGFAVIRSHPFWFVGVMIRRARNMPRLERSNVVATEPSVTHPLAMADGMPPAWSARPAELASRVALPSPQTRISVTASGEVLRIESDDFQRSDEITLPPIPVETNTDYLLRIRVKVERDGIAIRVVSANHGTVLASRNSGRTCCRMNSQ